MRQVPMILIAVFIIPWLTRADAATAEPSIVISGSERMVQTVQKLAERYTESHPDVTIEVIGGGSSAGVPALSERSATIAVLARPATDDEIRRVKRHLRKDLVGVPIATDAVVFFVRPDNPAESLSIDDVAKIFTHKISEWRQIGVTLVESPGEELTRQRRLPRSQGPPIDRIIPTAGSGSVHVLQRRAMHGKGFTAGKTEYDNHRDLVHAVGANQYALGFSGMGYAGGVKVLALKKDADAPAVLPTPESLRNRAYPLTHYLYFYFAGQPTGTPKDFLKFVLSAEGQSVINSADTGAVSLPFQTAEPSQ